MTKEILQQALDALYSDDVEKQSWAKTALMKAIAQPSLQAKEHREPV